jgi:hypothetical protein
MAGKERYTYEVTQDKFDELVRESDDNDGIIFIEYERSIGILREQPSGVRLDKVDEKYIG